MRIIIHTQYLRQQGCEDPWLFVKAKRGPASKNVWKSLAWVVIMFVRSPLHIWGSEQVMFQQTVLRKHFLCNVGVLFNIAID
jgi:hypothetical protein